MTRLDSWLACHLSRLVRIALVLQVSGFAFFVAGTHGAFAPMPNPPTTTDFASFYAAGSLANAGQAADAYDAAHHRAAEEAATAPGVEDKRFLYPPVFLLICAPLARLPYLAAFVAFEAVTSLLWLMLATAVALGRAGSRPADRATAAACLAAIPAVWWALGWGQNAFLSAGLMAAGTLGLRRRPLLAGAALGALCFKPHFGVLIPLALLAGGHWRAILGAATAVLLLCAASAALFGLQAWRVFADMLLHARQTAESTILLAGHVDIGGAARLLGAGGGVSWVLQAAASTLAAACVAWAWWHTRGRDTPPARIAAANAILVAATLTAMPFVLFYDLVMASVAAAWLVRAADLSFWRRYEPTWLAALWFATLVAYPAAALLHAATGAAVGVALLWLAMARVRDATV